MTEVEIANRFEDIVQFAEIGSFINRPLKVLFGNADEVGFCRGNTFKSKMFSD